MLPSLSQYGTSNGCNERQQWSKGSLRKLSSSAVGGPTAFFPPYNVVHSV